MANFLPVNGQMETKKGKLTLTALQGYVGGFIKFIELLTGDYMIVNETAIEGLAALNETATELAGRAGPIYGNAVLCEPDEIA